MGLHGGKWQPWSLALNEAAPCTVLMVLAFDSAHGLSVPQAWNWLGCRFEIRAGRARPEWVVRDVPCGLAGCGILVRIDKEALHHHGRRRQRGHELTVDLPSHGPAAVHWRQGSTGWPPQPLVQHVARAFAETFGGREPWKRLAHLAPTVRDHKTPLETAAYYVRRTPRLSGLRRQIELASARWFLRAGCPPATPAYPGVRVYVR